MVSQKGVDTKNGLPPVAAFFFVKFTTVIFPAVSPQRGPTSITLLFANWSPSCVSTGIQLFPPRSGGLNLHEGTYNEGSASGWVRLSERYLKARQDLWPTQKKSQLHWANGKRLCLNCIWSLGNIRCEDCVFSSSSQRKTKRRRSITAFFSVF